MAQKLISIAIVIAIICQLSHQKPTIEENDSEVETDEGMRIFGMPTGCMANHNCTVYLVVDPTETGADFYMVWERDSKAQDRWVGAALSDDKIMGNDSVTECTLDSNNKVIVRQGLTFRKEKSLGVNIVETVRGIANVAGNFSDKVVSCSWSRARITKVDNLEFNIFDEKYYVFLAVGPVGEKDALRHHSARWISDTPQYLAKEATGNSTTNTPPKTTRRVMDH